MTKLLSLNSIMSSKLFSNRTAEPEKKYSCYTQRQWALLYTIMLFIWTAMMTTLAILGFAKVEYGFKLAKVDIEEELSKNSKANHHEETTNNEILLCTSLRFNLMTACALYLASWMGIMNLFAELLLLYGILTRTYAYVVPWTVISATSFVMCAATITMLSFSEPITGIGSEFLSSNLFCTVSVFLFGALMLCGYIITFRYCRSLRSLQAPNAQTQITTVKAYGGYTHTIKPAEQHEKKLLI